MDTYNTQLPAITLKEYGRNVQMIAEEILANPDYEERTRLSHTLVELMKQINPAIKEGEDYNHNIWDHLHIITNFQLDVDSPYAKPDIEVLTKKPEKVEYNSNRIAYKHYGKNVELLIERACEVEDEEDRKAAIIYLGKLMKRFYHTWNNKDNADDTVILQQITELSDGKLTLDDEIMKPGNLFDYKDPDAQPQQRTVTQRDGRGGGRDSRGGGRGGRDNRGGYDRNNRGGSNYRDNNNNRGGSGGGRDNNRGGGGSGPRRRRM